MENRIITFEANQQCLRKTGGPNIFATKTVSYVEAHFDLGENWTGFDSIEAVWWNDFVKPIPAVLDTEGICEVPHEVLTMKGEIYVNLVGSIAEGDVLTARLTTAPITAFCNKFNAELGAGTSQPITPSEYEQFVASVKEDANRAETAKEEARASAADAAESAAAAKESEENAKASEDNAAESESAAAESARQAEEAKQTILGMRAVATTLPEGSQATASYNNGLLTIGIPKGDTGNGIDHVSLNPDYTLTIFFTDSTSTTTTPIRGETGITPNFTIGTVETLAPTEDATATITGTAENPILNLGIPQGKTGEVSYEDLSSLLPRETVNGDIVSIPDGQSVIPVESLKVALEPIQNLHGYDKPWSGGAGKNKFPISDWFTAFSTAVNNLLVGDTSVLLPAGTYTLSFDYYTEDITSNVSFWRIYSEQVTYCDTTKQIGYGGMGLSLPTSWTNKVVTFTTTQDGWFAIDNGQLRGGVHYRNIQLESGSSATAWTPYSNICPISGHTEVDTHRTGKNLLDVSNATHNAWNIGSIPNKLLPNTQYTFSVNGNTNRGYSLYLAKSASPLNGEVALGTGYVSAEGKATITTPADMSEYGMLCLAGSTSGAGNENISAVLPQVELGSTATSYEPYQADTYHTDLGQTVYGGTLDIVSGELVVDRVMVDMGTLTWRIYLNRMYAQVADMDATRASIICSAYKTSDIGTFSVEDGCITSQLNDNYVIVYDSAYTDPAAFKTAMNGVQLCYELATPLTYQLTPQEVKLLLGNNNVWSDGEVTMIYNADVQLWVEKKLS